MVGHDVSNLMSQHSSQAILVFANGQDTRVDEYLSPKRSKTMLATSTTIEPKHPVKRTQEVQKH